MGKPRQSKKQNKRAQERRKVKTVIAKTQTVAASQATAFGSSNSSTQPANANRFKRIASALKTRGDGLVTKIKATRSAKFAGRASTRISAVASKLPRAAWLWIVLIISGIVIFTMSAATSGSYHSIDGYRITYKSVVTREQIEAKLAATGITGLPTQLLKYSEPTDRIREFRLETNDEQRKALLTKLSEDANAESTVYIDFHGTNPLTLHFTEFALGSAALVLAGLLTLLSFGRGDSAKQRFQYWLTAVVLSSVAIVAMTAVGILATRLTGFRLNPEVFSAYQLSLSVIALIGIYCGLASDRRHTVRKFFFPN